MKRLSVFLVGLLSVVLVFSVAGLADLTNTTDATLTLTNVIDITIPTQDLGETTITQDGDLDGWNNGTVGKKELGTFTVNIITLTDYSTIISYTADLSNAAPNSLTNDPLYVDSSTNHDGSISDMNINGSSSLDPDFDNSNNIDTAGESQQYDLSVDPSVLTENFDSGNKIVFTVDVTLSEGST